MQRRLFITSIANAVSDTTAPTVAITSSETSPTFAATIPLTITFSEAVTGFVVGDITVSGCTLAGFATADNIVFTVNATPTANSITVDVGAGVCQDATGNNNAAATQFAITSLYYGLALRLNASSGLFKDAARTQAATADGDAIYSWVDSSANGFIASQATADNRPVLKLNIVNGKPTVRFDGSNDTLSIAHHANLNFTTMTMFLIVKRLGAGAAYNTPIVKAPTSWDDGWGVAPQGGGETTSQRFWVKAYNTNYVETAVANLANFTAMECIYDASNVQMLLNGASQGTDPYSGEIGAPTDACIIGGYASNGGFANWDYAEILIWNSALSAGLRTAIRGYITSQYAINF